MSQFVMTIIDRQIIPPQGIYLREITSDEDFLQSIALKYFGTLDNCRLIVDKSDCSEPLIDDVWNAQRSNTDIEELAFVKLLTMLIDYQHKFICWCGSDFLELPIIASKADLLNELLSQTAEQPAEFYAQYLALE